MVMVVRWRYSFSDTVSGINDVNKEGEA